MDAAPPTDDDIVETKPERRRDSSWAVLLAGIVFVIAVTATFSILMTRDDNDPATPAFSLVLIDQFDRPASEDGLGEGWVSDAGGWAIEAGVALLREPVANGDNLTTYDIGSSGQAVNMKVAGTALCGLVVRYEDAFNYMGLIRVSPFAVWNIVEMVDGKETVIGKVPDEDANNSNVTLTATDSVVSASVGLKTVTIVHESAPAGTRFGLIARNEGAATCSWDDVTAQRAN